MGRQDDQLAPPAACRLTHPHSLPLADRRRTPAAPARPSSTRVPPRSPAPSRTSRQPWPPPRPPRAGTATRRPLQARFERRGLWVRPRAAAGAPASLAPQVQLSAGWRPEGAPRRPSRPPRPTVLARDRSGVQGREASGVRVHVKVGAAGEQLQGAQVSPGRGVPERPRRRRRHGAAAGRPAPRGTREQVRAHQAHRAQQHQGANWVDEHGPQQHLHPLSGPVQLTGPDSAAAAFAGCVTRQSVGKVLQPERGMEVWAGFHRLPKTGLAQAPSRRGQK